MDFGRAAGGLLQTALAATGQQVTLGTLTWADPPAGSTEKVPTVTNKQECVSAAVTRPTPRQSQEDLGTRREGSYVLVAPGSATVTEGMLVKATAGPYAGRYFRVMGLPAKPSGHHWEAAVEPLAADERAVQDDVLT